MKNGTSVSQNNFKNDDRFPDKLFPGTSANNLASLKYCNHVTKSHQSGTSTQETHTTYLQQVKGLSAPAKLDFPNWS